MSIYKPESKAISYGEYQATKSKVIKSQIYKRNDMATTLGNISTPKETLSNNIKFIKILPVKVLPPIDEQSFNANQIETSNVNIDTISDTNLNTFETNITEPNTDFDVNQLQPTPTLESIQTSETENITFGNELNSSEETQNFNIINTDDISNTQTLTEQNNDIVQTFDEKNLQINDIGNTFKVPETIVDTNMITTDTNVDLNTFETTNIDTTTNDLPQTFDESTFKTTEITPTIQEITNIDINNYPTSEPIIDTQTTTNENLDINALTSDTTTDIVTNTNFDTNNIQTSEPIADTLGTTENIENFDLNTLTTTNDVPQTFDESTFQTAEITPSIEINNIQETANIDKNTITENYDINTFAPTNIDTTTNDLPQTFGESTFQTTEIKPTIQETINLDINTYPTSEPIIDSQTTTNENFDINTLTQTEITSSFDTNAIPEATIQTSETTATENFDLTNLATTNVETTNYESKEIPVTTTTDNYEYGTVDTNIGSTDINIDSNSTENFENFNITNLPPVTDNEKTQSFDINNFQTSEPINETQTDSTPSFEINALPTTTIDSTPAIEETPSFDINALNTNTNEQTYNSSEIKINEVSTVDTIPDLRATPTFNLDNIESINTGYETNNIIDSTSALQITTSAPEFDINAFIPSNNVETNIENNTFDVTNFQTSVETTPISFEATTSSNIETIDINSLNTNNNKATEEAFNITDIPISTINEVQNYTPEININEYLTTKEINKDSINIKTIQDKYKLKETKSIFVPKTLSEINIPHFPEEKKDEKIVFSIVTPLKGNIAKGNAEKNVAKVTLVPNYGISTYRPFERIKFGKNKNEVNIRKINKSLIAPTEYKISTFNPKNQKYKC